MLLVREWVVEDVEWSWWQLLVGIHEVWVA